MKVFSCHEGKPVAEAKGAFMVFFAAPELKVYKKILEDDYKI
jgi:hypothetical protein